MILVSSEIGRKCNCSETRKTDSVCRDRNRRLEILQSLNKKGECQGNKRVESQLVYVTIRNLDRVENKRVEDKENFPPFPS